MKITASHSAPQSHKQLNWLGYTLVIFILGALIGNNVPSSIIQEFKELPVGLSRAFTASSPLPVLSIDMEFENYNVLLQSRERALKKGAYISNNNDFVTATLQLNGLVIPIRMRLQEGPADNLGEDDKWDFEVRTRQGQRLWEMERFYLQDPASNNWLNGWAFSQALKREDILACNYTFARLIINGDDRGIYAVQQGFDDALLASQGRPVGIVTGFDTDLLWESVVYFDGNPQAAYNNPITNLSATDFQYFEVNTFHDTEVENDPLLATQRDIAIGLLRALQTGDLEASQVFDVTRYSRFLALVDLWGATDGVSLVNLHYYYNSDTGRMEPIGFNANALSTDERLSLAATYGDIALQTGYVREAQRISTDEYLDALQADLEPEFKELQGALNQEGVYIEPPWDLLRQRQERLRRSLNPTQPVFAYLGSPDLSTEGIIRVEVGNVLNLPVEITGFDINGATFLPANRQWLPETADELLVEQPNSIALQAFNARQSPIIRYARFDIPLTEIYEVDKELDFMEEIDIQVVTRILGQNTTHMTLARPGYPDIYIVAGQP